MQELNTLTVSLSASIRKQVYVNVCMLNVDEEGLQCQRGDTDEIKHVMEIQEYGLLRYLRAPCGEKRWTWHNRIGAYKDLSLRGNGRRSERKDSMFSIIFPSIMWLVRMLIFSQHHVRTPCLDAETYERMSMM